MHHPLDQFHVSEDIVLPYRIYYQTMYLVLKTFLVFLLFFCQDQSFHLFFHCQKTTYLLCLESVEEFYHSFFVLNQHNIFWKMIQNMIHVLHLFFSYLCWMGYRFFLAKSKFDSILHPIADVDLNVHLVVLVYSSL